MAARRTIRRPVVTLEQRVAALEEKTQDIHRHMNDDGTVPYLQINARTGIFTNYWSKKPVGQGAALSVGTAIDRFAIYGEIDAGADGFAACPDHPSTAIYGSVVVPHRSGEAQPNIAFESHAANAPTGNLPFYGDYQYAPSSPLVPTEGIRLVEMAADGAIQRQVSISANGVTLKSGVQNVASWFCQKVGETMKNLWP